MPLVVDRLPYGRICS